MTEGLQSWYVKNTNTTCLCCGKMITGTCQGKGEYAYCTKCFNCEGECCK